MRLAPPDPLLGTHTVFLLPSHALAMNFEFKLRHLIIMIEERKQYPIKFKPKTHEHQT